MIDVDTNALSLLELWRMLVLAQRGWVLACVAAHTLNVIDNKSIRLHMCNIYLQNCGGYDGSAY